MKRIALLVGVLAWSLLVALGPSVALGDGGKGVKVQPLTPKPGDVITVKGDLLGPNSEVEVRIIGSGVDVDLGEVQADAEGDFTAQFRVPADLAPGTYRLQAKGAESATTELTVVGGAGAAPAAVGGATATASAPAEEPVLRVRSLPESIALVVLFGLLAALGLFFARSARPVAH